nr:ADP-ribosylglycohydrolase family protein [Candidatus Sigynarchaeota archaeon]
MAGDDERLVDRFKGTLVGLGAGDAFGAPFEFLKTKNIQARFGGKVTTFLEEGGVAGPGEFTDDTQMALCIVDAILEANCIEPGVVARKFIDWYASRPPDIGMLTHQVLTSIIAGQHWSVAAKEIWESEGGNDPSRNPRASNGSLMRCAPVALFDCRDEEELVDDSIITSSITHYDPRCTYSCAVLNALIAKNLFRDNTKPPLDFKDDFAGMARLVGDHSPKLRDLLVSLDHAVARYTAGSVTFEAISASYRDQGGYVLTSLAIALSSFYCTTSFEDAVIESANSGSDNDTTAAICGALAGSYYGYASIPREWLKKLVQAELLERKSEALYALVQKKFLEHTK